MEDRVRLVLILLLIGSMPLLGSCSTAGLVSYGLTHRGPSDRISDAARAAGGQLNDLVPAAMATGLARADVEAALIRAGYRVDVQDPFLRPDQQQEVREADVWHMSSSVFPCVTDYFVFVRYDEDGRLSSAVGTSHQAACT